MIEFPRAAEHYRHFLDSVFALIQETPPLFDDAPQLPELELQSLWFAGALGREFESTCGKSVRVIQFGHWNHSAGPDFTETAAEIDGETLSGSIEIDPQPTDWEAHGHSTNPDFDNVVLHLFPRPAAAGTERFFTRNTRNENIVQVALRPDLIERAPRYSMPAEAHLGRCSKPLESMDREKIDSLLAAAAQFRLAEKARRIALASEIHGRDDALFQCIAEALGYRPNKLPMRVLAQRFPIRQLRKLSVIEREACLFGAAGFLGTKPLDDADAESETRAYLRELWDAWWKIRDESGGPELAWKLSGNRPLNHPQRRLGALAELVFRWDEFTSMLGKPGWPRRVRKLLGELEHSFWSHHYTLKSKFVAKPMALIGKDRMNDILGNVLFPLLVAEDPSQWDAYLDLPPSLENEKLRRATIRLFGEHPDKDKIAKRFYRQQALLQIYEDFCLEDVSDCADCPFPEQLSQWKA
ncbi:MAG: DUF2851 family protein [Verrucomicrobiota bacterium]